VSTLAVEQPTLEGLEREPTLDDVVLSVWTTLISHRTAECPVCHGEMAPLYAAHALPVGGRCNECGAVLN
jgi:hypothetical protein